MSNRGPLQRRYSMGRENLHKSRAGGRRGHDTSAGRGRGPSGAAEQRQGRAARQAAQVLTPGACLTRGIDLKLNNTQWAAVLAAGFRPLARKGKGTGPQRAGEPLSMRPRGWPPKSPRSG